MKNKNISGFICLVLVNLLVIVVGLTDLYGFYTKRMYSLILLGVIIFTYKKLYTPQVKHANPYQLFVHLSDFCYSIVLVQIIKIVIQAVHGLFI